VVSAIDAKVRLKALEVLREKFSSLVNDIMEGKPPTLVIKKRTLSNTIYDSASGLLKLGDATFKRSFFNVAEAKKFMQTVLMASIIYEALKNNEYPTIRDLYYRGKHTIKYRDPITRKVREENTWEEQKESDSVIRDLEVFIDMLREEMLILSKEKGKVVGDMRIRSGDDVIDLSRMGHGAYAIEPTPDFIEFLDVNAEYVLVIEKDAVFQQLHRLGYWKKNKALLVTSAGQPDRATRRFVRRLNEELKLPVYILTDSIPADEVVVVKDPITDEVRVDSVEELVGKYFTNLERERMDVPLEVLSWDPKTGRVRWSHIAYVYRHRVKEPILKIRTKGRGVVRVTKAHSLFVFRDGRIQVIPAKEIRPGDYIVVAKSLPYLTNSAESVITVAHILRETTAKHFRQLNNRNAVFIVKDGMKIRLEEASEDDIFKAEAVKLSRSKWLIPNKVKVDEDLAWFMGVYTARGSDLNNRCLLLSFNLREKDLIDKVVKVVKEKFNVVPKVDVNTDREQVRIQINSKILHVIFSEIGLLGKATTKRVPNVILNSPYNVALAYVKGLIDGGGLSDEYGGITYPVKNPILARQIFILLQALGLNPTLTQDGDNIALKVVKEDRQISLDVHRYSSTNVKTELASIPDGGYLVNSETHPNHVFGDAIVVPVEYVEEEPYEGYVYDFAVPGDNSFIGGYGVVYHNSDPYGWYIYSVFKVGSITLSYESERLATPSARFLGVMMTDIFGSQKLNKKPYLTEAERRNYIIKAKERDKKRAKELENYKWFQTPRWKIEIDVFREKEAKLEIEALTSKGLVFLADKYLPEKISVGDWIA